MDGSESPKVGQKSWFGTSQNANAASGKEAAVQEVVSDFGVAIGLCMMSKSIATSVP